jgi:L-lactate utilization protein LutC
MNFLKKFFKNIGGTSPKEEENKISDLQDNLSIDEKFVKKFIHKGGKFLYCTTLAEVEKNLVQILQENQWNNVVCFDASLQQVLLKIKSAKTENILHNLPLFTECESLNAEDGSIMFSTKQLRDKKLMELPGNFIVYAKTSQLVKDTRDGISGVRNRSEKNSATIISSIKDFTPNKTDVDFMSYGNNNSKILYLLLLEDL